MGVRGGLLGYLRQKQFCQICGSRFVATVARLERLIVLATSVVLVESSAPISVDSYTKCFKGKCQTILRTS
jgi:hypothetical protein